MAATVDINDLPTPALILDLDAFEQNIAKMAQYCKQVGSGFRPHGKTHKSAWIARQQLNAGAVGISVATVAEAEAMAQAGIESILLTSPVVGPEKLDRLINLSGKVPEFIAAVGSKLQAERLSDLAGRRGVTVNVLVDVDVGDGRTGELPGQPALQLAQNVDRLPSLRLRGIQAYSGLSSHVVGFEARKRTSLEAMGKAAETREMFKSSGLDCSILSGGSTGTYNIDSEAGLVTELQVGSYVFMDVDYRRIGGKENPQLYDDFLPALNCLTTVVSAAHKGRVTVDAGVKALSSDAGCPPELVGRAGLSYKWFGDEFGLIEAEGDADLPKLGDRLRLIVPHCDPTVNMYDLIYLVRGERVEGAIRICARRGDQASGVELLA